MAQNKKYTKGAAKNILFFVGKNDKTHIYVLKILGQNRPKYYLIPTTPFKYYIFFVGKNDKTHTVYTF